MTLYFAQKFKQLRRNAEMTQEEIAAVFGISPQAVSRWETGTTYPDIELLPILSEFFSVSIEELLGVEHSKRKAKADEYKARFKDCMEHGKINEAITLSRDAVKEFPRDWALQNQLMYALFVSCSDDGDIADWRENQERYKQEIIDIAGNIIAHCTDDVIRLEAKARLGFHYCEIGDLDKGKAVFDSLPTLDSCKESMMYWALRGEERTRYNREMFSQFLTRMLWNLWAIDDDGDDYTQTITRLLTYEKMIALVYDPDDYGDWNLALAQLYFYRLAPIAAVHQQSPDLYTFMQKGLSYLKAFAAMPEAYCHTSYFVKGVCDHRYAHTADSRTPWDIAADTLCSDAAYDAVRSDEPFVQVLNELKALTFAE